MSMEKNNIYFVYSRNKLDFKKFIKTQLNADVINYNDIISKLIKNDANSDKPSENLINIHLRKKIIKTIKNKNDNDNIIYSIKNLTYNTIETITNLINKLSGKSYNINLIILNKDKLKITIPEDFLKHFSNIKYINIH